MAANNNPESSNINSSSWANQNQLIYQIRSLSKTYGEICALAPISLEIRKGQAMCLLGYNGSGKSTLLRLLAFLEKPTSGEIKFFGDNVQENAESGFFLRRQVTLLLQDPYLLRENVFRNVTLGLLLRHDKNNLEEKYHTAMLACGFNHPEDFAKRKAYALSGGERQRVALASRLILNPLALLLDEPTSNVDAKSAQCIVEALKQSQAHGMTIICATHDNELVDRLEPVKIVLKN